VIEVKGKSGAIYKTAPHILETAAPKTKKTIADQNLYGAKNKKAPHENKSAIAR